MTRSGKPEEGTDVHRPESPARRRWRKRRQPPAGQEQYGSDEDGHEQGESGRPESRVPRQEGVEAKKQKGHEERDGNEVSGGAYIGPEVGGDGGEIRHDAGLSLILTFILFALLVVCALGPQTAGWKHIAVAGGYWCVLFGILYWAARRGGAGEKAPVRTVFVESRLAIAILGFAAVAFRSPVLLEVVPDILAVAIAAAGGMDGVAVGDSRRLQAEASRRLAEQAPAEGQQ